MIDRSAALPQGDVTERHDPWGDRPALDGLRAIAVYLVVAYHSGSGKLQGGFIGVDLFFVLSGFLVTTIVLDEIRSSGRLDFLRFYARRARRLVPAATVTIVGVAALAVLTSTTIDRLAWVGDARAASLWFANWHFIAESSDYFRADDAASPYLHFWSLAIEEQFYLLFPVALVGVLRVTRKRLARVTVILGAAMLGGVGLQLFWAQRDANRAYLGTDARIYQLLLGTVLACLIWQFGVPRVVRRYSGPLLLGACSLFVVLASNLVSVSASARGFVAAVVAGACVIAAQVRDAGRASGLGLAGVRYLGQISYGTYLWHWPVVVLLRSIVEASPWAVFVASALVGTALAALSHALVELPIRTSPALHLRPRVAVLATIVTALVSGLVVAPRLLERPTQPAVRAHRTVNAPSDGDAGGSGTEVPKVDWKAAAQAAPGAPLCESTSGEDCIVRTGNGGTMLVVGDSHARMYLPAMRHIAQQHDLELALAYSTSCPWMRTSYPGGTPAGLDRCLTVREQTYSHLLDALDPDVVVLAGYPYSLYPDGLRSTADRGALAQAALLEQLVDESLGVLATRGRAVVLLEPTPTFDFDVLSCLSGALTTSECVAEAKLSSVEEQIYRAATERFPNTWSLDLDTLVCPSLPSCDPVIDGRPVWRDDDHLTNDFSATLGPVLEQQLVDRSILPVEVGP